MTIEDVKYSILIPVYNSESIVSKTVEETIKFFSSYNLSYEILLINDGSSDNSWDVIKGLAQSNKSIRAINLLKNYGQHSAIFCGMENCVGDLIITIDDDLQNPPEEIIHLINKIDEGFDLVFGKFRLKKHSWFRRQGTKIVSKLNSHIFQKPKGITLSNFRIFTKEVKDRAITMKTNKPYIPGILLLSSSIVGNVEVEHRPRSVGKSNYSMFKILRLLSRLLFNYSSYPLKLLSFLGVIVSLASFFAGSYYFSLAYFRGSEVPGWTTLVVMLSFFNGFLIIMLGVIGEYLSRILNQISKPKAYQIKEIIK